MLLEVVGYPEVRFFVLFTRDWPCQQLQIRYYRQSIAEEYYMRVYRLRISPRQKGGLVLQ